jgi:hypothetical protein
MMIPAHKIGREVEIRDGDVNGSTVSTWHACDKPRELQVVIDFRKSRQECNYHWPRANSWQMQDASAGLWDQAAAYMYISRLYVRRSA